MDKTFSVLLRAVGMVPRCFRLERESLLRWWRPGGLMTTSISLDADALNRLDISAVEAIAESWQKTATLAQTAEQDSTTNPKLTFEIAFPRDPSDPRELSEIPEVRLWFVRLDACYPWLPLILDWEAGELARYTAMLVPHQFSPQEGIQFNPEALEIFVMSKVFVCLDWMKQHNCVSRIRLQFMTKMLGYELDDGFFALLGA